jgi:thiol-disulfide isomerase/thioredoxin
MPVSLLKPRLFSSENFMKIKALVGFVTVSLLSLGITTACSSPFVTKNSSTEESTPGEPLAKELQGKPVVVDIYAKWCSACENIAPTIAQLKEKYAGKVHFVVLDVTDKSSTATAEARAKELGLSKFLASSKTSTGSLAIINPATGDILVQHRNNPILTAYTKVLDVAIAK